MRSGVAVLGLLLLRSAAEKRFLQSKLYEKDRELASLLLRVWNLQVRMS